MGNDASGGPTSDPTRNVLELVSAAVLRIDDMADLRARLVAAQLETVSTSARLRSKFLSRTQKLHQRHDREIHKAEQMRLDAVRGIDVAASKTESDRALQAINTLAATNKTDAENLRNALNNTAQTMAKQVSDVADALQKQTASSFTELSTRVAALEKSQYEGQGKQAVSDPQTARLAAAVEKLTEASAAGTGKSTGISMAWVVLLGAIAGLGGLVSAAVALYAVLKH
jgi:hypothetical protein